MNSGSKDLDALRETASKALISLLWLHVPIAAVIGMARGTDWLMPTILMIAFAAAATLSWRSRSQAICPRERPSIALPAKAAAGVGSGPPGPVATSIGTAIVKPICESGKGVRARLIPSARVNHVDASAGVCSSEVALFGA